jgi:hypothetical protein
LSQSSWLSLSQSSHRSKMMPIRSTLPTNPIWFHAVTATLRS